MEKIMRVSALFAALTCLFVAQSTLAQNISTDGSTQVDKNTDSAQLSEPLTVTLFSDRAAFDAAYPQASRVNFDSLIGHSAPFGVGRVRIFGGYQGAMTPQVLDSLVGLPANFWFGAQTTSTSFVLANLSAQIKFPSGANAFGFDVQCFACDGAGATPVPVNVVVLNTAGQMIYSTQLFPDGLTGVPTSVPAFLGVSANRPIGSIIVQRYSNWLFANLRYVSSQAPNQLSLSSSPSE
jgi:hypothetical protein